MSGAVCALDVRSVSKSYGATVALQDVSIELQAGEVHALLGENGAGKSTLVKILSGVVKPNVGTMRMGGEPYEPRSIVDARRGGVATAFQELSLVPNLTVAQNLSLPRQAKGKLGLVSGAATQKQGAAILNRFGLRLSPSAIVAGLTLAERQRLEITRAFACNPKVLILDEPTAALAETDWLFGLVRQATAAGAAVLYISHRLAEVRELCQRATVLRNGRSIGTVGLEDATDHNIFEMMVGRSQAEEMQRRAATGQSTRPAVLEAEGLAGGSLKNISLTLREGEILGVAGLEGQGQRALFRALVGLAPLDSGSVKVDGASVRLSGPDVALKTGRGIAFLPEERKTEGIFPALATATNIVLPDRRADWTRGSRLGAPGARRRSRLVLGGRPQSALSRFPDRRPFRRQPAEGHAGARDADRRQNPPALRSDPRRRRRDQAVDLCGHSTVRRVRRRCPALFLGTA